MTVHPETATDCPYCAEAIVQASFGNTRQWVHCGTYTARCYQATTDPNQVVIING